MEEAVLEAITAAAGRPEGGSGPSCLSLEASGELSLRFGVDRREIAALALDNGIVPLRYLRNIGTVGLAGQAILLRSKVTVVGAGGIGGHAAELLARMGVGAVALLDPDVFEETNLNRQNFSCGAVTGMPKVEVVGARLLEINPDVRVEGRQLAVDSGNLPGLLGGSDAVVDALDSIDDRLVLQEACARSGVVMVHGAIAGSCVQATTIYPGDPGITAFAPPAPAGEKRRGIEVETGNPATTPAAAAAIQVHEVVNVILGRPSALRGRLLFIDMEDWTVDFIELDAR